MKAIKLVLLFAAALLAIAPLCGDEIRRDGFERADLGPEWLVPIGEFAIVDGVLTSRELPDAGHGAVARWQVPFRNASISFRFRLTGSKQFNFVVDDQNCREAHAGHICRVIFHEKLVRLGDDREGAMRNDIFAARRAGEMTPELSTLLKDRVKAIRQDLAQSRWHTANITIEGDLLAVAINGSPLGELRSPGIGHPTKTKFGFTVLGEGAEFDDLVIAVD